MSAVSDLSAAAPTATGPILVTGGRGFVGAAVVRHFLDQGQAVHVYGPESPVPLPAGATQTLGSVEDGALLDATLQAVRPRAVVHLAAFSSGPVGLARSGEADPERMLTVNVLGFRRLLQACLTQGVRRVVWSSSTVVLGRASGLSERLDESAPRQPAVHYGLSKVLAEDIAAFHRQRDGLETVALRIPLMLGPGLWYRGAAAWIQDLVQQAVDGHPVETAAPAVPFDAMHVADLGPLVQALIERPEIPAAVYHVAGFTTSSADIAACLGTLVSGFAPCIRTVEPAIVYPLVSQSLLERDTGWHHRHDLRSTLRDMIQERRASTP